MTSYHGCGVVKTHSFTVTHKYASNNARPRVVAGPQGGGGGSVPNKSILAEPRVGS